MLGPGQCLAVPRHHPSGSAAPKYTVLSFYDQKHEISNTVFLKKTFALEKPYWLNTNYNMNGFKAPLRCVGFKA